MSSAKSSKSKIEFQVLTLFPEVFESLKSYSLIGKAIENKIAKVETLQIRHFAGDKHRMVDDKPFGGGAGMVLKPDVLYQAWKAAKPNKNTLTVFLSPQGKLLTEKTAKDLSKYKKVILVCGHYEGVDERFIEECVDQEISIGDYVLTGGEIPAMVLIDAVVRMLPGVVGNQQNIIEDSLETGLLKYPQYTRPRIFQKKEVPEVLLEGNHQKIAKWREEESIKRTLRKRPDLLSKKQ